MAGNMAWNAGKGAFQNFSGKHAHQDPTLRSVDNAHYKGAKVEKRQEDGQTDLVLDTKKIGKYRKDSAYYEYLGIPEKDAKILSKVVASARFLDNGLHISHFQFGVNSIIELIPGAGDFVGGLLSFGLVVLPVCLVSKGPGKTKVLALAVRNLGTGSLIGLLPLFGDYIDTKIKFNVRSASALEAMLLKRVKEAAREERDAEKAGRTTGYQRADTNGHHGAGGAATNEHHDSAPPTLPPKRFFTADDLPKGPKPAATARAPVAQTQPKKSSGSFFRRRGAAQDRQEVGTTMEEVAPVRPLRPKPSTHERGGHF